MKELNVGWEEWTTRKLPVHSERVHAGELRCSCSDEIGEAVPHRVEPR